jgi:hypothetical protein
MQGLSVRDYFPVIVGGLAIYTTNPVRGFHETLTKHERMLLDRAASAVEDDRYIPATPESVAAEQQFIIDYLERNREEQTFYAFRVADGTEPWTAPILYTGGLHNPLTPPCYNPHTLEAYVFKLARYVDLVPSVGRSVREHAQVASARLREYRAERETWYMAFGDRSIGGENYTNPPHFARSLFAAGALVEHLDAEQLTRFVDVPWCEADLYFIEKAAFALWVAGGRRWEMLDSPVRNEP